MKYSKTEIDTIIEQNKDRLLSYIRDLERNHSSWGLYNKNDTFIVLFDLRTEDIYNIVRGQGYSSIVAEGLERGHIIKVYEFKSGCLIDMAEEGIVDTAMTTDEYIEDYLTAVPEITIEYLSTVENKNKGEKIE